MNKNNVFLTETCNMTVECEKQTVETVFDLFNDTVSAIEAEALSRAEFELKTYGKLPFSAEKTCEFVERYDTFINEPDFEADIFTVGLMEMENFWSNMAKNTRFKVVSREETYGKSSIYEIGNGRVPFGFLLNNMTFDGQNAFFLTSKSHSKSARRLFSKKLHYYPRTERIAEELASVGATSLDAWRILKSEDARYWYGQLKANNVLQGKDKALLKAIRKFEGGLTFSCYIEQLEEELEKIMAILPDLADWEAYDLQIRQREIEEELLSLTQEDNSLKAESSVEEMFYY